MSNRIGYYVLPLFFPFRFWLRIFYSIFIFSFTDLFVWIYCFFSVFLVSLPFFSVGWFYFVENKIVLGASLVWLLVLLFVPRSFIFVRINYLVTCPSWMLYSCCFHVYIYSLHEFHLRIFLSLSYVLQNLELGNFCSLFKRW